MCMQILEIIHVEDMHDHPIDNLVWPSIWGWKAMDLVSLVSIHDQRIE
jgi:hypothetical protein